MIVVARVVFLCKCSTDVDASLVGQNVETASEHPLRLLRGDDRHFALLDAKHHGEEHLADFRTRLARGEYWLVGTQRDRIVTYTWLHVRRRCAYPYLPGCTFELPADFGYGYDAWTVPELRGVGLRRRVFAAELAILRNLYRKSWQASFFVAHQLDGARRSLGRIGIDVVPLWRIALGRDRRLAWDALAEHGGVRPACECDAV